MTCVWCAWASWQCATTTRSQAPELAAADEVLKAFHASGEAELRALAAQAGTTSVEMLCGVLAAALGRPTHRRPAWRESAADRGGRSSRLDNEDWSASRSTCHDQAGRVPPLHTCQAACWPHRSLTAPSRHGGHPPLTVPGGPTGFVVQPAKQVDMFAAPKASGPSPAAWRQQYVVSWMCVARRRVVQLFQRPATPSIVDASVYAICGVRLAQLQLARVALELVADVLLATPTFAVPRKGGQGGPTIPRFAY